MVLIKTVFPCFYWCGQFAVNSSSSEPLKENENSKISDFCLRTCGSGCYRCWWMDGSNHDIKGDEAVLSSAFHFYV